MTKQNAIDSMCEGVKVTHHSFTDKEYITMKDGKVEDEDGYRLDWNEFWRFRVSKSFNEGWSVFD